MSKKKKKKDGKSPKLPKHITGVKVPKELRETGGKLLEAINNPIVVDMAAAALLAAAANLREGTARAKQPAADSDAASDQDQPKADTASNLGSIIAAAAVDGLRKIAETKRGGGKG